MIDVKWLEDCIQAGEFLYGEFPVSVLKKMYETKCPPVTITEIEDGFKSADCMMSYIQNGTKGEKSFLTPVIVSDPQMKAMLKNASDNGNPYASLHFEEDELKYLAADQAQVEEYWIPTASQIEELMDKNCIHTRAMRDLEGQIRKKGGNPEYLAGLWPQISTGKLDHYESIKAVIEGLYPRAYEETKTWKEDETVPREMEEDIPTMDDLNALMPYINEFINGVNRRDRKGWPPSDLFRKMHPNGLTQMPTLMPGSVHAAKTMKSVEAQIREMGANVDYSSIDNFAMVGQFGERRIVKVGRNDPCPCGSGKKYKYCHGR